jgi:hypothetical protein
MYIGMPLIWTSIDSQIPYRMTILKELGGLHVLKERMRTWKMRRERKSMCMSNI